MTKDQISNNNFTNLSQDKEIVIEKYSEEEENSQPKSKQVVLDEPEQILEPGSGLNESVKQSLQGTLYEIVEPDSAMQSNPYELTNEEPMSLKKLKKRQPLSSEEETPNLK